MSTKEWLEKLKQELSDLRKTVNDWLDELDDQIDFAIESDKNERDL